MHGAWRAVAALVCSVFAAGAGAAAAHAGTASGRPARFTAAAGERNDLTVASGSGGMVQFTDARAPVSAGPWCAPFPLGAANCDPDGDPRDTDGGGVSVDLADNDDRATIRSIPGTGTHPGVLRILGGAGNDQIENFAIGVLHLDGGEGDDRLVAGPAADALLLGGAGADVMTSALDCCAIASYNDHDATGVRVTLDATANDGIAGEGDDVRTAGVIGSPGPDVIIGDARANTLVGSGGADRVAGGAGADVIDATLHYPQPSDHPDGTDGPDTVTCGAGDDQVVADADDTVAADCERVRVGLSVTPELMFDSGAARASRTGTLKFTYRVKFPNPDNALTSRSSLRLVDGRDRAASSTARFVLGGDSNVARARVTLNRATRARLARSRAGALTLIAQRISRDARPGSAAAGYERFNAPVTIRRPGRR
jgi:hypothetical protein